MFYLKSLWAGVVSHWLDFVEITTETQRQKDGKSMLLTQQIIEAQDQGYLPNHLKLENLQALLFSKVKAGEDVSDIMKAIEIFTDIERDKRELEEFEKNATKPSFIDFWFNLIIIASLLYIPVMVYLTQVNPKCSTRLCDLLSIPMDAIAKPMRGWME